MAFKKHGVLITIYFLLNLSELICLVLTQEDVPPSLAEHVEYQSSEIPNDDNQPPIHAIDSVPIEIQDPPIEAVYHSEPNEIDEGLKLLNQPSYAVNQDSNGPVEVNQSPDRVNQDTNVINHPPNLADQAPSAPNELPNVVNQGARALNSEAVNQPPRIHSPHKPSTVGFDYGSVESVEPNNEFENLPGVQHEFRIEVLAGMSECIFQTLAENAQLHVSFQVLRGMDRNIEFLIQGPGNLVLEHIQWSSEASLQKTVPLAGLYRFCLNNELSKFSSKLIYFYMVTYVEEKWHQHSRNILDFFGEAEDIQQSLDTVDERVKKMHVEQASSRRNVISDWYLIQDNHSYVQTMSVILCVVIVMSSAFQVFFVRHLFSVRSSKAKLKPRA